MTYGRRSLAWLGLGVGLFLGCRKESAGRAETVLPPVEPSVLVVRVVDERGPLSGVEVEVTSTRTSFSAGGTSGYLADTQSLRTDEDGWLRVPLRRPGETWPKSLPPRARSFALPSSEEVRVEVVTSEASGARTLAGLVAPGEIHLGDLPLAPMERIAAGRVLDLEGRPVAGARVHFRGPVARLATAQMSSLTLTPGRVTTGAEGDFVVYAPPGERPAPLRLLAREGERLSELVSVDPGAEDVLLRLSSGIGRLEGRLLLDREIPPERLRIGWQGEDLETWEWLEEGEALDDHWVRPDGSFSIRNPAGTYRLQVLLDSDVLAEHDGVRVEAGRTRTDPRLEPIDLRGKLHTFRLTLVPPGPPSSLRGLCLARGMGEPMGCYEHFEGSPTVISVHPRVDVELWVDGFRPTRVPNVHSDETVTLEPGWPIRLVLADHVPLPEPPVSWSVVLIDESPFFHLTRLTFESGEREVRGIATQHGEIELEWIRTEARGDELLESAWGGDREGPAQTIFVADVPDEQEFVLGWGPAPR
jgi:hypothetical protein